MANFSPRIGGILDTLITLGYTVASYVFLLVVVAIIRWRKRVVAHKKEFVYTKPSHRHRLELFLSTSFVWFGVEVVSTLLSIVFFIVQLTQTDLAIPYRTVVILDLVLAMYFSILGLFRFYVADDKRQHLTSSVFTVNFFTVLPVYISLARDVYAILGFLRIIRLTEIIRLINLMRGVKDATPNKYIHYIVDKISEGLITQIIVLILQILILVFLTAGIVQLLEVNGDFWIVGGPSQPNMTFFDAIWLLIVTMSTVGYGDISPKTYLGRVCMMILILSSIVILPAQLTRIVDLLKGRPVRIGPTYSTSTEKIICAGHVSLEALQQIAGTLFSLESRLGKKVRLVVLASEAPDTATKQFLLSPFYQGLVSYIQGSPMVHVNQIEIGAESAEACFILANKLPDNAQSEDERNILRLWAFKNSGLINSFVQILKPVNVHRALMLPHTGPQHVICLETMKLNFMAQNCLWPGLSTLVANLLRTVPENVDEKWDTWLKEYWFGAKHSIYRKKLSSMFTGQTFVEAANMVFSYWGMILFAIEINGAVFLNPGKGHRIKAEEIGFIIAPSDARAHEVSLELPVLFRSVREHALPVEFQELDGVDKHTNHYKKKKAKKIRKNMQPGVGNTPGVGTPETNNPLYGKGKNKASSSDDGAGENSEIEGEGSEQPTPAKDVQLSSLDLSGSDRSDDEENSEPRNGLPSGANLRASAHVHREGFDHSSLQYKKMRNPADINDVTLPFFKGAGHIIVTGGMGSSLKDFIQPLRATYLSNLHVDMPVVILTKDDLSDMWGEISVFPDIYVIVGEATNIDDLHRAGVANARRVVIFAKPSSVSQNEYDIGMIDSDAMLIGLTIESLNLGIANVFVELVHGENTKFMDLESLKAGRISDVHSVPATYLTPYYAAGTCFTQQTFDILISQGYRNPTVVQIVRQLIAGDPIIKRDQNHKPADRHLPSHPSTPQLRTPKSNNKKKPTEDTAAQMCASRLIQLPLPPHFTSRDKVYQFQDLFRWLLNEHEILALGLYRPASLRKNNIHPYTLACPPPKTKLLEKDRIFALVLSCQLDDVYERVCCQDVNTIPQSFNSSNPYASPNLSIFTKKSPNFTASNRTSSFYNYQNYNNNNTPQQNSSMYGVNTPASLRQNEDVDNEEELV